MNGKIGLLTFHRSTNFGSMLQTYGLYKKIVDMGYECEVVDYRCPAIEQRENLRVGKMSLKPKQLVKHILFQPAVNRKAKALLDFAAANMCLSPEFSPQTIAASNERYCTFVVGSDIVWGRDITDHDYTYFLDFVMADTRKYAFSSSVGSYDSLSDDAHVATLLRRFSRIAVRENEALDWVEALSGMKADWVCDPTMLLSREEWEQAVPIKETSKKYVLVYFNDPSGKCVADAITYARKHNLRVKMINYAIPIKGTRTIKPSSLSEFLSLIHNADAVFTASYHGMLFSLYYEKKFSFYTRAHSSRMLSLAERLGVMDRCGSMCDELPQGSIDYNAVNEKIRNFRDESLEVLRGMLEA